MFLKLKLRTKLLAAFSLAAILTLIVGGVGIYGVSSLNRGLKEIATNDLPSVENLLEIKVSNTAIARAQRTLLNPEINLERRERQYKIIEAELLKKEKAVSDYENISKTSDEAILWRELAAALKEYDEMGKNFLTSSKELDKTGILNPVSLVQKLEAFRGDHYSLMNRTLELIVTSAMFEGGEDATACNFGRWVSDVKIENPVVIREMKEIKQAHDNFHENVKNAKALMRQAKSDEAVAVYRITIKDDAEAVFKKFEVMKQEALKAENLYLAMNRLAMNDLAQKMNDSQALTEKLLKLITDAAHSNQKSAEQTSFVAQALSFSGTFVGFALALFFGIYLSFSIARVLKRITSGISDGSGQVASAAAEVSSASQSLAEGASQQAASIEETSSSLEEMSSMTKQNADNARQADSLMKQTNLVVNKASDSMNQLTASMQEITTASEETSKIIKTIDEIAFQTNLLALNAAVEAARAGEAGAGFAVVADEVRNLALRAADAAKNTALLIEGTVKKVSDGSILVKTTNDAFTEVALNAEKVGELVGEIAAASSEQAQGIEQVNIAVTEMDKVTQQNAANAEESASASEELNAQAEELKGFVSELMEMVEGSSKASARDYYDAEKHLLSVKPAVAGNLKQAFPVVKKKRNALQHSKEVSPDDIIPMDDGDLKKF